MNTREIRDSPAGLRYSSDLYSTPFLRIESETGSPAATRISTLQAPFAAVTHEKVPTDEVTRRVALGCATPLGFLMVAPNVNARAVWFEPANPANSAPRAPRPVPIVPPPQAHTIEIVIKVSSESNRGFIVLSPCILGSFNSSEATNDDFTASLFPLLRANIGVVFRKGGASALMK